MNTLRIERQNKTYHLVRGSGLQRSKRSKRRSERKTRALGAEQLIEALERPRHASAKLRQPLWCQEVAGKNSERHRTQTNGGGARPLEQEWLREHGTKYALEWVALDGAELVAHGKSARQVLQEAKAKGYHRPLIVQVPEQPELPFGGW